MRNVSYHFVDWLCMFGAFNYNLRHSHTVDNLSTWIVCVSIADKNIMFHLRHINSPMNCRLQQSSHTAIKYNRRRDKKKSH